MRAVGLAVALLAAALLAAACGGKGSGDDGCEGIPTALCGGPDIELPAAQGAMTFTAKAITPERAGNACPSGPFGSEIPTGGGLDGNTYLKNVVDGEGAANVTCRVAGTSTFEIAGHVLLGGRGLIVAGTLAADHTGLGEVSIIDSANLPSKLVGSGCRLSASRSASGENLQVKTGSVWGSFLCAAVEAAPSTSCEASGYFVFENCER